MIGSADTTVIQARARTAAAGLTVPLVASFSSLRYDLPSSGRAAATRVTRQDCVSSCGIHGEGLSGCGGAATAAAVPGLDRSSDLAHAIAIVKGGRRKKAKRE